MFCFVLHNSILLLMDYVVMQKVMEHVQERYQNIIICILIAWQKMCQDNQALTTSVNITMTMPLSVLYIHVLIKIYFS